MVKFENRTVFIEMPNGEIREKNIGAKGYDFKYEEVVASEIVGVPEEFKNEKILIMASPPSSDVYSFLIKKDSGKLGSGFPIYIKKDSASIWTLKLANQQYE